MLKGKNVWLWCGMGYWVNRVVGAEVESSEITPLVHMLHSQKARDFMIENQETIDAQRKVSSQAGGELLSA